MPTNTIGKVYEAGDIIFRQGERGDCMYVIQEGQVEVLVEQAGQVTRLAVRGAGDFFGEMALFEREARMATVRALGQARILKVDRKNLLRSIHDDPSLAFHIVETLSRRVRELSREVAVYRSASEAIAPTGTSALRRLLVGTYPRAGSQSAEGEAPGYYEPEETLCAN